VISRPGAGRVILARYVAGQPAEHGSQPFEVEVGQAVAQPVVEGGRCAPEPEKGLLSGRGQLDDVGAPVSRVPGAGDQSLRVHGVEVVCQRRLPHADRLGEVPLAGHLAGLQV